MSVDKTDFLAIAGDTFEGELDMGDNALIRPILKDFSTKAYNHGTILYDTDIDLSLGNVHIINPGGNLSLSFVNYVPSGNASTFLLEIINGGRWTITFPATVDWTSGLAPNLINSGTDILAFYTRNGGATWHGVVVSSNSR